jgi:hypothetical protein
MRLGLIALILPCLAGLACLGPGSLADAETPDSNDSVPEAASIHWKLPSKIRPRIHLSASQVPLFPEDDPARLDPRKWSAVASVLGATCSLRVETGDYDVIWRVGSLDAVKPGASLTLFYEAATGDRIGPTYCWRGDRTLAERYWSKGDSARYETANYMYYRSGELYSYDEQMREHRNHMGYESFERMEELFSQTGHLIGFVLASGGESHKSKSVTYWLGTAISGKEFDRRRTDLQLRLLPALQ